VPICLIQSQLCIALTRTALEIEPLSRKSTELRSGLLFLGQSRWGNQNAGLWMGVDRQFNIAYIHKRSKRGRTVYHLGFNAKANLIFTFLFLRRSLKNETNLNTRRKKSKINTMDIFRNNCRRVIGKKMKITLKQARKCLYWPPKFTRMILI